MNINLVSSDNYVNKYNIEFTARNYFTDRTQLAQYLKSGMTAEEIANIHDVTVGRVYYLIRAFGLKTPRSIKSNFNDSNLDKLNEIIPQLINKGATVREMAKLIPEKRSIIEKWIRLHFPEGFRQVKRDRIAAFLQSDYTDEQIAVLTNRSPVTIKNLRTSFNNYKKINNNFFKS